MRRARSRFVSPGNLHVVGVHDAVDEAEPHPARNQRRLAPDDFVEEPPVRLPGVSRTGKMPLESVVGQFPDAVPVISGVKILERSDTDMALGNPG